MSSQTICTLTVTKPKQVRVRAVDLSYHTMHIFTQLTNRIKQSCRKESLMPGNS